jgi:hypothetical protein
MKRYALLAIGLIILITVIFMSVIIFGENRYRYECQDPVMWSDPSCNQPICDASGTCTKDVLHKLSGDIYEKGK